MAYNGYLLKMGDTTIPFKYMRYDNYSVTVNTQDIDTQQNGNGVVVRNVLDHSSIKIEWYFPNSSNSFLQ